MGEARLESLPYFFISGRYGKSDVDIVEFLQNVDIPQTRTTWFEWSRAIDVP
jgi:hypothetical protein